MRNFSVKIVKRYFYELFLFDHEYIQELVGNLSIRMVYGNVSWLSLHWPWSNDWMADNKELKLKEDNLKVSGNGEPEKQRLESEPRSNHRPRINGMKIEYNECWHCYLCLWFKKKNECIFIFLFICHFLMIQKWYLWVILLMCFKKLKQ